MTTITKWLNNPYVLGFLIVGGSILDLILWGIASDLNKSEWASWVQGVGTIVAIAGAFLVADRQVSQQRRHAAALVRQIFYPVACALDELAFVYGAPSGPRREAGDDEPDIFDPEKWREVAEFAIFVLDHYTKFESRVHRYEAGLNLLSAKGLTAALALEAELEDAIRDAVQPLRNPPHRYDVATSSVEFLSNAPSWSSRFALQTFNRHVQDCMAKLEREAS